MSVYRWLLRYPRKFAFTFTVVVAYLVYLLLPLVEIQYYLWIGVVLTFVIGDTISTALLGRYGLEEQQGYTRMICGAQPDLLCAFITRMLVFVVAVLGYLAVFQYGFGLEYSVIVITALSTPLVLMVMGLAALLLNGSAIYFASRVS